MKQLIKHLLRTNRAEILGKSLLNCHVIGVHSIILLDAPEKRIRLYFADVNHELYKNYGLPQSLAYHPHHCQLTLHIVQGIVSNRIAKLVDEQDGNDCEYLNRYRYTSKITTGKEMGFVFEGTDILKIEKDKVLYGGESVFMMAHEIHTVACPQKMICSWLVYEGAERPSYQPFAWSNNDLSNVSTDGLYQKPSMEQIIDILFKSGVATL